MDDEYDSTSSAPALLLEMAAADDVQGFRRAVEQRGAAVHAPAPWYGPRSAGRGSGSGGGGMGYEMRTPLQVAAMYGSVGVMGYILMMPRCGVEDVNRACGSDGATALHCAAAGGAPGSREAIVMLLNAGADADAVDAAGRRPADLIRSRIRMRQAAAAVAELEGLLVLRNDVVTATAAGEEKEEDSASWSSTSSCSLSTPPSPPQRKEYPPDSTLPDIASGLYSTDEFRMYVYKVAPCPRAYSHDWTDCPFAHPGENARRRDPRRVPYYSPAPCPDFRRSAAVSGAAAATCPRGDGCEFAHGVFESWLHPAQYRTRMCKDEGRCARRVCFFAHSQEEMRKPAEALDLGVIAAMGLGGGGQQQRQQQEKKGGAVMVPGMNEMDMGYSPRMKQSPPQQQQQQFLPSGYRTPTRFPGAASTPCSPRTPRSPAPALSSYGSIDNNQNHSSSPQTHSRAASAFAANRSLSFSADRTCSRAAARTRLYLPGISNLSGWGSADGKLDWGIKGDELSMLRKTPSDRGQQQQQQQQQQVALEPDVSWVQSIVIDGPGGSETDADLDVGGLLRLNPGGRSPWVVAPVDPFFLEHEPLVA